MYLSIAIYDEKGYLHLRVIESIFVMANFTSRYAAILKLIEGVLNAYHFLYRYTKYLIFLRNTLPVSFCDIYHQWVMNLLGFEPRFLMTRD